MQRLLKIGTRGSPLAMTQAHMVRDALVAAHGLEALGGLPEFIVLRTSGDRIQDRPLREIGGKGLFTKEIEEALLCGAIDVAVHSAKDMPTQGQDGLALVGALPREDVRDVLISRAGYSLETLPKAARIGTTSLRRRAQLLRRRPDLIVQDLRGNVGTRLAKLEAGEIDALVLAKAGLARLGLAPKGVVVLNSNDMLPAAGQGAIGLEIRRADLATQKLLEAISHAPSLLALKAERALLHILDGSCRSPIGAHAIISGERVDLQALVLTPDGGQAYSAKREGAAGDAVALAISAGEEIRAKAPPGFIASFLSGE